MWVEIDINKRRERGALRRALRKRKSLFMLSYKNRGDSAPAPSIQYPYCKVKK